MKDEHEPEIVEGEFDTALRGSQIESVTVTGKLERPSMITIVLKNDRTVSFSPKMEVWKGGITAAIEGQLGTRIDDDGQTVLELSSEEEEC